MLLEIFHFLCDFNKEVSIKGKSIEKYCFQLFSFISNVYSIEQLMKSYIMIY